jgi:LytS/YehU family sensor histidine kinase
VSLFIYILNILLAFSSFLFYNSIYWQKLHLPNATLNVVRLLPILLLLSIDVIASHFFFKNNVYLNSVELMICSLLIFISLLYLKVVKEKKLQEVYIDNLRIAKDHAEIEALKLQLHPHFLFNSLNTLHHLIKPKNEEARKYVQQLADVSRYILKNKAKELVLLTDELSFAQQYFYLLGIRYGQAIHLNINVDIVKAGDYLVVPISIQILMENAIKHNRFTVDEPLNLLVSFDDEYITVQNNLCGIVTNDSLHIGLKNLSERSLMITNKLLIVTTSDVAFTVRVPLLKYK